MSTKQSITQTAFKLFLENGYANTSMRDIVNNTNLSKGAIYHYFESKEKLYLEVVEKYFIKYFKQIDFQKLENLSLNEINDILKKFFVSFTPQNISISNKGVSRHFVFFFEAFEYHPTFKKDVQFFYANLKKAITKSLKNEKIENPEKIALDLIAKYQGVLFWQSVFPKQKIDKILMNI